MSSDSEITVVSFTTLLATLCLDARDVLVGALQMAGCMKNARLVSKVVRDVVDVSVLAVKLNVEEADQMRAAAGDRFLLSRWPRLGKLSVGVKDGNFRIRDPDFSDYLTSIFTDPPLESTRSITDLSLGPSNNFTATVPATTVIASLLQRLAALRRVALLLNLSGQTTQQQLLCDALASLPSLEELVLRGNFFLPPAVPHAPGMAGRLKRLEVGGLSCGLYGQEHGARGLAWVAAASTELRVLETIDLSALPSSSGLIRDLTALLDRPPPCLTTVRLSFADMGYGSITWELKLQSGRVTEARQSRGPLYNVPKFAEEVLLPALGRDRRLDLLQLDNLAVSLSPREALLPMSELARRSNRVWVGTLRLCGGVTALAGMDAIQAFGTLPNKICIEGNATVYTVQLHKHGGVRGAEAAVALSTVLNRRPEPEWAALGGMEMGILAAELAIERLMAEAAGGVEALEAAGSVVAEEVVPSRPSPSDSKEQCMHYVRIHSPLISALAWAPGTLNVWVQRLFEQAAEKLTKPAHEAVGTAEKKAFDRWEELDNAFCRATTGRAGLECYLPVPAARTVLLCCATEEGASFLVATAREALAAGCFPANDDAIQVYKVPSQPDLHARLQEAGQAFWDSGRGGCEQQRLRLLLELGLELVQRPPVVLMKSMLGGRGPRDDEVKYSDGFDDDIEDDGDYDDDDDGHDFDDYEDYYSNDDFEL